MQLAVGSADELRVRDAAQQPESLEKLLIHREQILADLVVSWQRARHEDAAFVRNRHRRRRIAARDGEHDAAIEHDRVDVEHVTGNELFEQVVGARVTED